MRYELFLVFATLLLSISGKPLIDSSKTHFINSSNFTDRSLKGNIAKVFELEYNKAKGDWPQYTYDTTENVVVWTEQDKSGMYHIKMLNVSSGDMIYDREYYFTETYYFSTPMFFAPNRIVITFDQEPAIHIFDKWSGLLTNSFRVNDEYETRFRPNNDMNSTTIISPVYQLDSTHLLILGKNSTTMFDLWSLRMVYQKPAQKQYPYRLSVPAFSPQAKAMVEGYCVYPNFPKADYLDATNLTDGTSLWNTNALKTTGRVSVGSDNSVFVTKGGGAFFDYRSGKNLKGIGGGACWDSTVAFNGDRSKMLLTDIGGSVQLMEIGGGNVNQRFYRQFKGNAFTKCEGTSMFIPGSGDSHVLLTGYNYTTSEYLFAVLEMTWGAPIFMRKSKTANMSNTKVYEYRQNRFNEFWVIQHIDGIGKGNLEWVEISDGMQFSTQANTYILLYDGARPADLIVQYEFSKMANMDVFERYFKWQIDLDDKTGGTFASYDLIGRSFWKKGIYFLGEVEYTNPARHVLLGLVET